LQKMKKFETEKFEEGQRNLGRSRLPSF
jgi:hypothetical protein